MGDMEDGSGPGKWRVKGRKHKNMRLRNWGRVGVASSALDLARVGLADSEREKTGVGEGRASPEEHCSVGQGAHQQVRVMVPVHVQAARQRVAKALYTHGLALQHLQGVPVSAPPATQTLPPPCPLQPGLLIPLKPTPSAQQAPSPGRV